MDELKMCFFGSRPAHRGMMRVEMRIVPDDECGGGESGCHLANEILASLSAIGDMHCGPSPG